MISVNPLFALTLILISIPPMLGVFGGPHFFFFALTSYVILMAVLRFKGYTWQSTIYACLAGTVPTSFVNIFGGSYGEFPVSWFNVFLFLLCIHLMLSIVHTPNKSIKYISTILIGSAFLFWMLLSLINSRYRLDGSKYYLTAASSLIIGLGVVENRTSKRLVTAAYLQGAFITGVTIVLQFISYYSFDFPIGNTQIFPARVTFQSLFTDCSFVSLYLSSAACLLLIPKGYRHYPLILAFLFFSVLSSARTGIFAFLCVMGIRALISRKGITKRIFSIALLATLLLATLAILRIVRPTEILTSDNGRIKTYLTGFRNFSSHPLFGTGIGMSNYVLSPLTDTELPHNSYIQILAQTGIIASVFFVAFFLSLISNSRVVNLQASTALVCILIGALFIPDVLNSRFIAIIIALGLLGNSSSERAVNPESVNDQRTFTRYKFETGDY